MPEICILRPNFPICVIMCFYSVLSIRVKVHLEKFWTQNNTIEFIKIVGNPFSFLIFYISLLYREKNCFIAQAIYYKR